MTKKLINHSLIPLSLLAACSAVAQNAAPEGGNIPPVTLEPKPGPMLNHFTLGYRMGFNLSAKFKNVGIFPSQSNPGSTASGTDHNYDDGYNRVDITGNDHEPGFNHHTWYWGYQDDSQYDAEANTITMHSASSVGGVSHERDDDPQPGFELTYSRELLRRDRWRAGFETGFGYTDLNITDNHPVTAQLNRTTDTYQLPEGFVPPSAPYSGTFEGPGAIISDTPTRTFDSSAASVSGTREFGADLFGFRLGPYIEFPLNETFSVGLNGGFSFVYAYSTLRYNETVTTPSGPLPISGHGNNDDVLFGGYIGGNISAVLNERWTAFANAQWQDVGTYTHRSHATRESASLDLSNSVFLSIGLAYSF